jgi:hypothetical protein
MFIVNMFSINGSKVVFALVFLSCFPDTPAEPHVFWRKRGQFVTEQGYLHVHLHLNVSSLLDNIYKAEDLIDRVEHMKHSTSGRTVGDMGRTMIAGRRRELDDQQARVRHLLSLGDPIPGVEQHAGRQRRFVGELLGLGGILTGTIFGLYNMHELGILQGQVDKQGMAINSLMHAVDDIHHRMNEQALAINFMEALLQKTTADLEEYVWNNDIFNAINVMVGDIMEQTDDFETAMDALISKKLATTVLHRGRLRKILQNAAEEVAKLGYSLLVKTELEAFQCQASFIMMQDGPIARMIL